MKNLISLHKTSSICVAFFLVLLITEQLRGELSPEVQEVLNNGVIAAKQRDYLLAIRLFQDARKIAPDASEIYYNLGLAESKIPGRELRAIAWFSAYLAANPNAPNAAAVNDFVAGLHIKNQGNLNRLITIVQDAAGKADRGSSDEFNAYKVPALWAEAGDLAAALKTADLLKSQRSLAQEEIAEVQSSAGDFAGALKTAALIQDPVP